MRLYGTMDIDNSGVLNIGGVSAVELVRNFGSPLLVLDEEGIRQNMRKYVSAFSKYYPEGKAAYAGKAFINRTLCKIIAEEGLGLDVVSGGELFVALEAGFPAARLYFHGNNKLPAELKMACEAGVGRIMIDNLEEAVLLNELVEEGHKSRVILRVTPGIEAHTHEFIQTGQLDSKFGVSLYRGQALETVKNILQLRGLELTGIHAHIGSQIFNLTSFSREIDLMLEFMAGVRTETGHILRELDLGGGLGIAHTEDEENPDIDEYVRMIAGRVEERTDRLDYPLPEIIVEPGRSVIGTAGVSLYSIGTVKDIPAVRKYLVVDGGMTDNIRPALYGAQYDAVLADRVQGEKTELVTVAGRCCESGDILIHDIKLPRAVPGDILAVPCTGAYTYAMSSNYNGLPRPAVVLVNEGKADLIIKRESYQDLIRNDLIPERFASLEQ